MKKNTMLAAALLATFAHGAQAQSDDAWTGFYVGGQVGVTDPSGDGGAFGFDTNLDGDFGDTVNTAANANAFSPGFCSGAALAATPGSGCSDDDDAEEYGARLGYDWQFGQFVFGLVGEYSLQDARDSVSGFSTTPALYTFTRELESTAALRGRFGLAFGGESEWLGYVTGGFVRGKVDNRFNSSNTRNAFLLDSDDEVDGTQLGLGLERAFGERFSIGVEYLMTELDDDGTRVRVAQGTAPANNPFLLVNPNGTDLRRTDDEFELDSFRITANLRF